MSNVAAASSGTGTAGPAAGSGARPARRGFPAVALTGLAVLVALPFVGGGYWTYTLGLCFANAIIIASVSLLVRYAGEVSIGHGVFAAAGAYAVAILEKSFGLPLAASLPIAALAGAVLGLVFAFPSRRLSDRKSVV